MLRQAKDTDFESIYLIYMDPSVNPFISWESMDRNSFRLIFNEILSSSDLYVYQAQDEAIGVVRIDRGKHRRSHTAYVGGLGIRSSNQGQGIGRKMMFDVINKLKTENIHRIELIVESDNPKAIQFYESLGFQKEGVLKNFFKRKNEEYFVDDYYMSLLI